MKRNGLPDTSGDMAHIVRLFDIVNGFFNRCRGDVVLVFLCVSCKADAKEIGKALYTNDYLAEFNNHIF